MTRWNLHYILKGKEPVEVDLDTWARWFGKAGRERVVAQTKMANGVLVSTVSLGLDHSFGEGPPQLFETMTFVGPSGEDETCRRYSTWAEAEVGHMEEVERMEALIADATLNKVNQEPSA